MRSPCDCRTMTAEYPCHFMGTARASCDDFAIAVPGSYDHRKSLRLLCDVFVQKRPAKTLRSSHDRRATTVRPPCDAHTGIVRCSYDVSSGYVSMILNFLYNSELNKIVEAKTTLRRPKNVRYTEIVRKWEFRHRTITVSLS